MHELTKNVCQIKFQKKRSTLFIYLLSTWFIRYKHFNNYGWTTVISGSGANWTTELCTDGSTIVTYIIHIYADHRVHRRPKNPRRARIHSFTTNINLIKRERVTKKIIIVNGIILRMSCTKSKLFSKVELWAEEEKSSPWYRALTRVRALKTTSVPRERVSMRFSNALVKGLTYIWAINMTTHIIKATIIFRRLSNTKVRTIMSTNLRKIRKPSHGKREAGKQKTGSWVLNGPNSISRMASVEDIAWPLLCCVSEHVSWSVLLQELEDVSSLLLVLSTLLCREEQFFNKRYIQKQQNGRGKMQAIQNCNTEIRPNFKR